MSTDASRRRLDEILIAEGLVSEAQLKEALLRQKAHGGKVGSQLLYHRYIDEAGLVQALTLQFECEGVVLSDLQISKPILEMIPKKVALARRVLPFDFDPEANTLKVACEDPSDIEVRNELSFIARGKKLKFYIAAELALNIAISRYYLGEETSLEDSLSLQIPEEATETGRIDIRSTEWENATATVEHRETMLLVTDEEYCGPLLQSILERDEFDVITTDSADDAIDLIGNQQFHTVFIKDSVPGDYIDLIDRVRKSSPRTRVRYYESAAGLLVNEDSFKTEGDLMVRNLDLFTSMMSTASKQAENHSGRVGHYTDKLCLKLGLPDKERLMIVSAAYLHDLAKFHYSSEQTRDYRETIKLTTKLLQSLNYPPVVVQMLRSMYLDLGGKFTKRLPIERLGGNILTIVDLYCENVTADERLLLDKFDAIKRKFRDLTGKLFMVEVAEAFIAMVQDDILTQQSSQQTAQIMLFAREPGSISPCHLRLRNEGFRTMTPGGLDAMVDLYQRSRPDLMVLAIPGEPKMVKSFIETLRSRKIDFEQTPTFALIDSDTVPAVTSLLEKGLEDVIANDGNLDLLVVKIQKIQLQLQNRQKQRDEAGEQSGAAGRLADMNLIDLLQALGPSQKTARITVTSGDNELDRMTLYLNQGAIVFAEYGEKKGASAVYETLGWTDGRWRVEPVTESSLPAPNNDLSNESILMEGCRLLDEKVHQGNIF